MKDIKVCVGTSCHLKGSYNVLLSFQQMIERYGLHDEVNIQAAFCMGHCQQGVCVMVDDDIYSVSPESARSFFKKTIVGEDA
ncbi:MAG: NAD(P)H-dependent oxidoreductase subunit E [Clostridia bacterium]|nr:NAD(P)H-dependent oxidoreductase subunit E [Clostridia bacterium]